MTPAIECRNLTKVYRSGPLFRRRTVCAVGGATFKLAPGEICGLIGPNGAGKTTLLALVAGLLFPDRGTATVFGRAPRSLEARRRLAYMPETPAFLDPYTGRQTLEYHAALSGHSPRAARDAATGLIERLGLEDACDRPTHTYSQGTKQRLALAVALVRRPSLLLLDEPANGLDPPGALRLRELLAEEAQRGTAVLISSHRLDELEKLTSHFLFLNEGRLTRLKPQTGTGGEIHVRIGFSAGGDAVDAFCAAWPVLERSDTHLRVRVPEVDAVAPLVRALVEAGVAVTTVEPQRTGVEEAFMHLYEGTNR